MTLQTATAARPRLGSGEDLQSKKVQVIRQRRRRRPGGGDSRHPPTGHRSKAGGPTQDQSSRQCMSVRQTIFRSTGPGPPRATRHSRVVARNAAATNGKMPGQRAMTIRITRQCSRRPPTVTNNCFTPQQLSTGAAATFAENPRSNLCCPRITFSAPARPPRENGSHYVQGSPWWSIQRFSAQLTASATRLAGCDA